MSASVTTEIAELREEIRFHERKYRREAAAVVSDSEYDQLMARLKKLEAEHPELVTPDSPTQHVGSDLEDELPKVAHRVPMLSIENTYSIEALREYGNRVAKLLPSETIEWVVELKIDGVAVSLIYEDGLLVRCLNRGDGVTGNDITNNVLTVKDIPHRLRGENVPHLLEVRGEIYMTKSGLIGFNEQQKAKQKRGDKKAKLLKNVRNAVAGSITRDNPCVCAERPLQFFCHSVGDTSSLQATTHMEFLREMAGYGVSPTPNAECFSSFEAAVEHCEQWVTQVDDLDFEIDGLVLKVNRFDQRERLGSTSISPRWVIAYKFASYEATTRLNTIRVQVGKTGAITPVAELEPVELAGVTVRRASLHNADEIERKDIRPHDMIVVERAGKVIPHVLRVESHLRPMESFESKQFKFPSVCPVCKAALVKDEGGVCIRCPNPTCPKQIVERICYYASRKAMNIDELGDEVVKALVKKGLVHTYGDLYRLTAGDLVGKLRYKAFGEEKAVEIIQSIASSKNRGLAHILFALAIPDIGGRQAVFLAEKFQTIEALLNSDAFAVAQAFDGNTIVAQMVHEFLHDKPLIDTFKRLELAGVAMRHVPSQELDELRGKKIRKVADSGYDVESMKERLKFFAGKDGMNFKKIGDITLQILFAEGLVRDYADFYCLKQDQLTKLRMPMREKEAKNLLSAIAKSKEAGLARVLNALSIRQVGFQNAVILSKAFNSMNALMNASVKEIEKALKTRRRLTKTIADIEKVAKKEDVGVIATNVYHFLHSPIGRKIVEDISSLGISMTTLPENAVSVQSLAGKTIVVTGTLQKYSREAIHALIARHGGYASSSVSHKTDYVVAGEKAGSKLDEAKRFGVQIINEAEFETLLRG